MKIPYLLTLGLLGLVASAPAGAGQPAPTTPPTYVNENSTDPAPLHLREIEGSVRGLGGDAMSRATVSLFTENDHALIATVMSDSKGNFRFEKMDKGVYRLVVRVEGTLHRQRSSSDRLIADRAPHGHRHHAAQGHRHLQLRYGEVGN